MPSTVKYETMLPWNPSAARIWSVVVKLLLPRAMTPRGGSSALTSDSDAWAKIRLHRKCRAMRRAHTRRSTGKRLPSHKIAGVKPAEIHTPTSHDVRKCHHGVGSPKYRLRVRS